MTEDDIKYLLASKDDYPVSHNMIIEYITAPKKISITKVIEQNNLLPIEDYIVDANDHYNLKLDTFKYCIMNYKLKFSKLFISMESDYNKQKIKKLEEELYDIKSKMTTEIAINTDFDTQVIKESIIPVNDDINKRFDNIETKIESTYFNIEKYIRKNNELKNVSTKIDKILEILSNSNLIEHLDTYSKKINTINIL